MSIRRSLLTVMLIGLMIITASCTRQPTEQPLDTAGQGMYRYMPMAEGNRWVYEGVGNEYAEYADEVMFTDGDRVQVKRENPGTDMVLVYEITRDRVVLLYSQEGYEDENILDREPNRNDIILQGPIEEGVTWQVGERTYIIKDTATTVETPAGTYRDAVMVHSTFEGSDHVINQYYVNLIGLVKSEFIADGQKIESLLKEYTVAN